MTKTMKSMIQEHGGGMKELLMRLAAIPAPSHHEEKRVAFITKWLTERGIDSFTDDAGNVLVPVNIDAKELSAARGISLYMAHTDVVFPDTEALPVEEHGGRIYAPGVGDDTACVAVMMTALETMAAEGIVPDTPTLAVFNVCEEGLGNLKGVKKVMSAFEGRIASFVSFDGGLEYIVNRAVGSHRYRVSVHTEGGHSYGDFGNRNAIHALSALIAALYSVKPPVRNGSRTTYNVGMIEGGTSVNTIAQDASMLFEYRSDDAECLALMKNAFEKLVAGFAATGVAIEYELVGLRPCGESADKAAQSALEARCVKAITGATGAEPKFCSGSTDANIPLSLGVPSAVFGLYAGGGAHTRGEWVETASLTKGLECAITLMGGSD